MTIFVTNLVTIALAYGIYTFIGPLRTFLRILWCVITDNLGEKATPKILKDIQDAEVIEGSSVTFRAKVQGYPTPRISWLKDGTKLTNSASYFMGKLKLNYQVCSCIS